MPGETEYDWDMEMTEAPAFRLSRRIAGFVIAAGTLAAQPLAAQDNRVHIDQIGSGSTVTIDQSAGVGQTANVTQDGTDNTISIEQRGSGLDKAEVTQDGDDLRGDREGDSAIGGVIVLDMRFCHFVATVKDNTDVILRFEIRRLLQIHGLISTTHKISD